jgi:hypothetical protein
VSVVVGAPGSFAHVSLVTTGLSLIDMNVAPAVAVQTPMFSEAAVPAQFGCGKKSIEPPQVAAEMVQLQLAQVSAKSAPTTRFVGAPGGQATSPGAAMHAFIDEGALHAPPLHADG